MSDPTTNARAGKFTATLPDTKVKSWKDGAVSEPALPLGFIPQTTLGPVNSKPSDKGIQGRTETAASGKQSFGEQILQGRERRWPSSSTTSLNIPHYGSSPPSYGSPVSITSTNLYGTPFGAQPTPPLYRPQSFGTPYHGTSNNAQYIGLNPPSYRAQHFNSPYQTFTASNTPFTTIAPPFPGFSPPDAFASEFHVPTTRETVLHSYLLRKVVVGAGLDSAARSLPPRCDPGTRQRLRDRIVSWLTDLTRATNLLWLHGSVKVGKTAIAQTIAEHCKDRGWLGATFFFSRSRDDVGRIIPTLVYQLAVAYPAYKEIASTSLLTDPTILDQTLRAQFRKLISEPLLQLGVRGVRRQPLLLVLDGLDECQSGVAIQRELIEIIAEFAFSANTSRLPVVWIITSRTEWEIVRAFSKCQSLQEELRIDDAENIQDVSMFLQNGFAKIRENNRSLFPGGEIWPREDQLSLVDSSTSGFFAVASAILHFVGGDGSSNPVARLEICVNLLRDSPSLLLKQPWLPLAWSYWDVYSRIPNEVWPTTLRILAFLVPMSESGVPAQLLANILFLDQATFYLSLRPLYSIMDIPEPKDASRLPIRFHHPSFLDFTRTLLEEDRYGDGASVTQVDLAMDLESFYVRWCDLWGMKSVRRLSTEAFQPYIPWPGEQASNDIFQSVSARIWEIWSRWRPIDLYGHLYCFNFAAHHDTGLFSQRIWSDMRRPTPAITNIFYKLYKWVGGEREALLRSSPKYLTDLRLLAEYAHLINYKTMKKVDFRYVESNPTGWSYVCLSLEGESTGPRYFPRMREVLLDPNPMYFLLGQDTFSCLVVMHRPTLPIRDFMMEAFGQIHTTLPGATNDNGVWPTTEDLEKIISASEIPKDVFTQAHLPSLARTIASFIAHPDYADPGGRLKRVLEIVSQNCDQTIILELLRAQSLHDIPQETRLVADRIFAFLICHAAKTSLHGIPVEKLSAFLGLGRGTVEKALRMANLILSNRPLLYPMSAVVDFDLSDLLEHCRGERAFVPKRDRNKQDPSPYHGNAISPQVWLETCIQYIRWCNHLPVEGQAKPDDQALSDGESISNTISVMTREEEVEALFKQEVLAGGHWIAFSQIVKDMAYRIVTELRDSNFFRVVPLYCDLHIPHYDETTTHFGTFVNNLYAYQVDLNLDRIIRVDRSCDTDDELLAKWERLGTCRKAIFPVDFTWVTCFFTTLQSDGVLDLFSRIATPPEGYHPLHMRLSTPARTPSPPHIPVIPPPMAQPGIIPPPLPYIPGYLPPTVHPPVIPQSPVPSIPYIPVTPPPVIPYEGYQHPHSHHPTPARTSSPPMIPFIPPNVSPESGPPRIIPPPRGVIHELPSIPNSSTTASTAVTPSPPHTPLAVTLGEDHQYPRPHHPTPTHASSLPPTPFIPPGMSPGSEPPRVIPPRTSVVYEAARASTLSSSTHSTEESSLPHRRPRSRRSRTTSSAHSHSYRGRSRSSSGDRNTSRSGSTRRIPRPGSPRPSIGPEKRVPGGGWCYFWLGHGTNTCLVTFELEDDDDDDNDEQAQPDNNEIN